MPHFFGREIDGRVEIGGADAAHLARSLRARPGEIISVVDPGDGAVGRLLTVRLASVSASSVTGQVMESVEHRPEPARRVTLAVAMLPAPALDLVLRAGTELGVHEFLLVQAERSVARGSKPERWAAICREAAMLAGRLRVPEVRGPVSLEQALAEALGPVMLDRAGAAGGLAGSEPVTLFVGPEGGWTDAERAAFAEAAATLGPRNLRAETAAIAAVAAALTSGR